MAEPGAPADGAVCSDAGSVDGIGGAATGGVPELAAAGGGEDCAGAGDCGIRDCRLCARAGADCADDADCAPCIGGTTGPEGAVSASAMPFAAGLAAGAAIIRPVQTPSAMPNSSAMLLPITR